MTIAVVRALIPDRPVFAREPYVGHGRLDYQVKNPPMVSGTCAVYVAGVLKTITTDYALDLELGLVTFVVAPTAGNEIVVTYQHTLLSDATIQVYLTLEGDDRLAAADSLDAIASNAAIVNKVMRLGDYQIDGAKVADSLRNHAAQLRVLGSNASGGSGLRIRRAARPQLINGGTEYTA